jgi:hypothetical protein
MCVPQGGAAERAARAAGYEAVGEEDDVRLA